MRKYLPCGLLLLAASWLSAASKGDQDEEYRQCLRSCALVHNCRDPKSDLVLPLSLRWLGWTCVDECKYQCMHEAVNESLLHGMPISQYYGKWPFVRVLGMQELFSVIFSVLNGLGHVLGYRLYVKKLGKEQAHWFMSPIIRFYCYVGVNAWIWSAIFHARDLVLTERLDYYSAMSVVFYGLYLTAVRMLRAAKRGTQSVLFAVFFVGFARHVYRMQMVKFDYGLNMGVLLSMGLAFSATWFGWGVRNWKRGIHAKMAAGWAVAVVLAACLELLDFPPLGGLVDAHALWHAATVPLSFLMYLILALDGADQLQSRQAIKPAKLIL